MPCPGPFHFSHSVDYIYDCCALPGPDVGLSIFVCVVEHTSFHFGLCARKFVMCLFCQYPGVVFMSGGITYDGHISKPGITELKVGSSENWYSRVR